MGRLVQKDKRNLSYLIPKLETPSEVRKRFWWSAGVLDQHDTPQCVGYAGWGWLAGGPTTNDPDFTPEELYHWAQEADEWPGEDYEGTSTLGLMKALKNKGFISEYRWATDGETLVAWILNKGPVLVGTTWYRDMFTPDKFGFIRPNGAEEGGHEWRIIGADRDLRCSDGTRGAVRMVNSWGHGWGDLGRAWVSFADLDKLVKNNGEAVTSDELKVAEVGGSSDTLIA
jgi:C1A family cysteine protease